MEENRKRERPFIHEQIVPRKNFKRILLTVLATIGLALIFGLVCGVTIYLSQKVLQEDTPTAQEQIIILRDDPSEGTTAGVKDTQAPTTASRPTAGSESSGEEGTLPDNEDAEAPENDRTEHIIQVQTEEEKLKEAYEEIRNAIVPLTITSSSGVDWFETQILSRREDFGVVFAVTTTRVLILTDGSSLPQDAKITTVINGVRKEAVLNATDSPSGLAVLSVERTDDLGEMIPQAALGNSFTVRTMDTIYMAGAPTGINGTVMAGRVINIQPNKGVVDGYEQLIYTDMTRSAGGTAFLFLRGGQLIGWVSDHTDDGTNLAVGNGISTVKYLIEDLSSKRPTAYVGIRCTEIQDTDEVPETPGNTETQGQQEIPNGLYVVEVVEGSPAYAAGIQLGDRLVSLGGGAVPSNHMFQLRLDAMTAGEDVEVQVQRRTAEGFETLTLMIRLGSR